MATPMAVLSCLKMLCVDRAGDVSAERVALWGAALEDISDEALRRATLVFVRDNENAFLPPVATIRRMALPPVHLDTAHIFQQIADLAGYCPNGNHGPRVETVRRALGDGIAAAYGSVGGGARIYADDPTTRDIARRDFTKELESLISERGPACLEIASRREDTRLLPAPQEYVPEPQEPTS